MGRWRKFLHSASRSQSFLWKTAIGMMLAGVAVGYAISELRPAGSAHLLERILAGAVKVTPGRELSRDAAFSNTVWPSLAEALRDPAVEFGQVVAIIPELAHLTGDTTAAPLRDILEERFTPTEAALAADFFAASRDDDPAARARLQMLSDAPEPARYASYALGRLAVERGEHRAAVDFFRKEGTNPDAVESHRMVVETLIAAGNFAELTRLQDDPRYAKLISPAVLLEQAIAERNWPDILRLVPLTQIAIHEWGVVVITIIAGVALAFFLVHLGEATALFSASALLCLFAFVAGVVSTTLTLYVVIWQNEMLHFSPDGELIHTFLYYIGGVGAREEVCKLILFLPLLPFLVRRDHELEALLVASFVGLGFAIEENVNYFLSTQGASAPGRFLTANFLHVMLTGVNGLYLFRVCTHGLRGLHEFLSVFGLTIVAHGLYDALPQLPDVELGSYLAMVVYIGVAIFYFNRAHLLRSDTRQTIGLTGSFVFGISLLAAAVIAFQMIGLGPAAGLQVIFPELLGTGVLLLMFFHVFNEQLAPLMMALPFDQFVIRCFAKVSV